MPDLSEAVPRLVPSSDVPDTAVVGRPEHKVDAVRLVKGNAAFVDDVELRGMLYAKVLRSPHAHARIVAIDDSEARALPGVHAVLHHGNTTAREVRLGRADLAQPQAVGPGQLRRQGPPCRRPGRRGRGGDARDRRGGVPADQGHLRGAARGLRRARGHRRRPPPSSTTSRTPTGSTTPPTTRATTSRARRSPTSAWRRRSRRPITSSSRRSASSSSSTPDRAAHRDRLARRGRAAGAAVARRRCRSTRAAWSRRCSGCR